MKMIDIPSACRLRTIAEQLLRLLGSQDRCRLVEDEQVRPAVERFQDLYALLLADRDVAHEGGRIDGQPETARQLPDPLLGPSFVQEEAGVRLDTEDDVLGDGHHRDEHEVLVHHPDTGLDRLASRRERCGLAVDADLSPVRPVKAVEDVHERRLAGAVLPEQCVHFTATDVERDPVVGHDARKLLADVPHLEYELVGRLIAHG